MYQQQPLRGFCLERQQVLTGPSQLGLLTSYLLLCGTLGMGSAFRVTAGCPWLEKAVPF